jgi:signal transduction histidine kinase
MSVIDRAHRLGLLLVATALPAAFLVDEVTASTAIVLVPVFGLGGWLRHRQRCDHEQRDAAAGRAPEVAGGDLRLPTSTTDVPGAIEAAIASLGFGPETIDNTLQLFVSPARVAADSRRLHQIIRNLVTNAIRHGGDAITIHTSTSNGFGRIEVSDNGPGLDDEEAEAIFAPYTRSPVGNVPTGSVALSLTASRRLARLMGGDLVAYRHDDITTFRLCLPLAELPVQELAAGD